MNLTGTVWYSTGLQIITLSGKAGRRLTQRQEDSAIWYTDGPNAGNDTWYTLDTLPTGEYLLKTIRLRPYLLDMDGTYSREATFPYRYFYRDTLGTTEEPLPVGNESNFCQES